MAEIAATMRYVDFPGRWRAALEQIRDNPIARAALRVRESVRNWGKGDARAAQKVIKDEVRSRSREIRGLAEEARDAMAAAKTQMGSGERSGDPRGWDR